MKYRMLLSDIDGTLRPFNSSIVPQKNVDAIQAIQDSGVYFVISTGRSYSGIPEGMLNGIIPDYWICAAGAQILRRDGSEICMSHMPLNELEALSEFCTKRNYPLRFIFSDGYYVYSGLEEYLTWAQKIGAQISMKDGTDKSRHLKELPFGSNALLSDEAVTEFYRLYPHIDLHFPLIKNNHRDILWKGMSKAAGLEMLLNICELSLEECVSVGDGANDIEILSMTGMSYCVENGSPLVMTAAKRICPSADDCGIASVCKELWPDSFRFL